MGSRGSKRSREGYSSKHRKKGRPVVHHHFYDDDGYYGHPDPYYSDPYHSDPYYRDPYSDSYRYIWFYD